MKKILLTASYLALTTFTFAQNPVLSFDGTDDYIDIGADVGNGVRTIEMWFKLDQAINPQLSDFVALTAREISLTNNTNEFAISFQPSHVANSGKLRFDIDGTLPFKSVYSDNDSWNADQWYHVAAVIDAIDGMMLFIDGIKQTSTHSYTEATSNSTSITTIGCWGNLFARFFKGKIDDVRFSSEALYNSDFTPPCPDALSTNSTIGLWNFNEGSGTLANDLSSNNFNGQINGPNWDNSNICFNAVAFDGTDDYIDIGADVGNGIRTIEMWFKLDQAINPQLSDFVALTAREISLTNNTNEFAISFQPSHVANSGKLRFDIDGTLPFKSVYSDNDSWNADQWYHVAAVIDAIDGMMLFIDGIKQTSTHSYTEATSNSTSITTIGCWGNLFARFFKGKIDDVRFSSEALYNSDFTPPCPDALSTNSTIGLWNFNEGSGTLANDLSSNNFSGQLIGATRIITDVCSDSTNLSISTFLDVHDISLKVYPNPSSGVFNFAISNEVSHSFELIVYNSVGQIIKSEEILENSFGLNMSNEKAGIYFYQITGSKVVKSGKLIKE